MPADPADPAAPAAYNGAERFERVLVKGKKSPARRIVCTIFAVLLWLVCAAALALVVYDYHNAAVVGGFIGTGDGLRYYSTIAGYFTQGQFISQNWLFAAIGAAAAAGLLGFVLFRIGLGKRMKVTTAGVEIKKAFSPTKRLTWDRIRLASKETDTSFVVCAENDKYRFDKLKNCDEAFGAITDMLSRRDAGMLVMPAVYGKKLARRKRIPAVIISVSIVALAAAAPFLVPKIMGLMAKQVTDVHYEWTVKSINAFDGRIFERTYKGTYSGGWLNGKPCGTGTIKLDNDSYKKVGNDIDFNIYSGTWFNGEFRKGTLKSQTMTSEIDVGSGGFRYGRMHGQGKFLTYKGILEGKFKYGMYLNVTHTSGNKVDHYKNGLVNR